MIGLLASGVDLRRRFPDSSTTSFDTSDYEKIGEQEESSFFSGAKCRRNRDAVMTNKSSFRCRQISWP